jgi:hypothetical protein
MINSHSPIGRLSVYVAGRKWRRLETALDLKRACGRDCVFVVNQDTGKIVFSDGSEMRSRRAARELSLSIEPGCTRRLRMEALVLWFALLYCSLDVAA